MDKVLQRGYVRLGEVKSLTQYFFVLKGGGGISMVYNGTSSGLNDALWATHFDIPAVISTLRSV